MDFDDFGFSAKLNRKFPVIYPAMIKIKIKIINVIIKIDLHSQDYLPYSLSYYFYNIYCLFFCYILYIKKLNFSIKIEFLFSLIFSH